MSTPQTVARFTGQGPYSKDSTPNTLGDVQGALTDAQAITESRLIALGVAQPYDAATNRLLAPIQARIAASALLGGQGDTERSSALWNQATDLLNALGDSIDVAQRETSDQGRSYGFFGPGLGDGLQSGHAGQTHLAG